MYKIKTLAQRGSAFLAVIGLLSGVVTSALPALVSADALNPLTERSLTLSSSSPGYHYLDGSGNSTYAPSGSGNNGRNTGETFTFKVSTDSTSGPTVKGFSFQYCTTSAGLCAGPGDNVWVDPDGAGGDPGARGPDTTSTTDLSVHYDSSPVAGTDFKIEYFDPAANAGAGAWVDDSTTGADWQIAGSVLQNPSDPTKNTGAKNYIKLYNDDSGLNLASGTQVRITFKGTDNNYITNPGSGAFFVKINDYRTADPTHLNATTHASDVIDGGVTVANVMNDSIQIQTKVLETMDFSVGTVNPDTQPASGGNHGTCDPIAPNLALDLGDQDAEFSLKTGHTYDTHSYWRLSSNSSGGATVYYSGNTLSNTVGDQIDAIGTTAQISHKGTEQFGLALDQTADNLDSGMTTQITNDAPPNTVPQTPHLAPHLTPLIAKVGGGGIGGPTDYSQGQGDINDEDTSGTDAKFAFDPNSLTVPVAIAQENADVVTCATGKMRYIANIAATTPAGVYTSRINYIAAPQY